MGWIRAYVERRVEEIINEIRSANMKIVDSAAPVVTQIPSHPSDTPPTPSNVIHVPIPMTVATADLYNAAKTVYAHLANEPKDSLMQVKWVELGIALKQYEAHGK